MTMRFAIFGDIHSNLEALEAVLAHAEANHCTHYICLGDIVGYAADPKACLDRVRALGGPVVKGNHDELACMDFNPDNVSQLATEGIAFTRSQLYPEDLDYLASLKFVRNVRDFTIVHATLDTPSHWGYVMNGLDAGASLSYQHTPLCFFGHTHVPKYYVRESGVRTYDGWDSISVETGKKYFVNVGSVGQPRDGDWRASYAIYHPAEHDIVLHRVPYDLETTQRKIIDSGLPPRLAERLAQGR
jgi:diadenosine tetraphosphatase ApaH/serine/threonine PP2A family protein phosphatase